MLAGHQFTALASDGANVLRFLALAAHADVEFDALTLVQRLVTIALDAGEVDEDVITLLARDEAVALLAIDEPDSSLCHTDSFLNMLRADVFGAPRSLLITMDNNESRSERLSDRCSERCRCRSALRLLCNF